MAIFVIFRVADPAKMAAALNRVFPGNHLQVHANEWLVSAVGTAKDVSDKLGITTPAVEAGAAIVMTMANYYGRAPTDIWDWIKTKAEAPGA